MIFSLPDDIVRNIYDVYDNTVQDCLWYIFISSSTYHEMIFTKEEPVVKQIHFSNFLNL